MKTSCNAIALLVVGLVTVFAQDRLLPAYPLPIGPRCPYLDKVEPSVEDIRDVRIEKNAGAEYEKAKVMMDRLLLQDSNKAIKGDLERQKAEQSMKVIDGEKDLNQMIMKPYLLTPAKEECQEKEYVIYGVYHMGGYCWLPWPHSQNVRYTDCVDKKCNRITWPWGNQSNYCVRSNYVAKYFHAFCPHLNAFKKFARKFPQCCVCRSFFCALRG